MRIKALMTLVAEQHTAVRRGEHMFSHLLADSAEPASLPDILLPDNYP